ncbi:DUF3667 domain-containing protein [Stakelama flava]|nr:DUF3667 domain-containing protein [Stakelama flava]
MEAAGDIATGALIGRVFEPSHGEGGADGGSGLCLNCGTALIGSHCHRCGQHAHVHRTLGAIGHEILHGVVHFEGKLWRTLPLLAWRPGVLTRRYIAGERARFVSPMALFLFSVFVMFAVFSIVGLQPPADLGAPAALTDNRLHLRITEQRGMLERSLADLRVERGRTADGTERAQQLDARIAQQDSELSGLGNAETLQGAVTGDKVETGSHWLDHGIEKWQKNPGLMAYKLQSSGYKFSWLLIPLSLPFMWLLFFWRRDIPIYDHAVFVTYSIAFMSLMFIVLTIAGALGVGGGTLTLIGGTVAIWHIARQLRGAYRLGPVGTVIRTVILLICTTIVMALFFFALLALGFG